MLGFHSSNNTYEGRVFETFKANLPDLKKGTILDLGCSKGITTSEISNMYKNCNIVGIDIDKSVIDFAIKNHSNKNVEFVCRDGYNYFKPNTFDIIFAMNNLFYEFRHKKNNSPNELLKKTLDMLKNNGYLLISQKNNDYLIIQKVSDKFKLIKIRDTDTEFDIEDIWDVVNSFN